jgi:hypothetical protein
MDSDDRKGERVPWFLGLGTQLYIMRFPCFPHYAVSMRMKRIDCFQDGEPITDERNVFLKSKVFW